MSDTGWWGSTIHTSKNSTAFWISPFQRSIHFRNIKKSMHLHFLLTGFGRMPTPGIAIKIHFRDCYSWWFLSIKVHPIDTKSTDSVMDFKLKLIQSEKWFFNLCWETIRKTSPEHTSYFDYLPLSNPCSSDVSRWNNRVCYALPIDRINSPGISVSCPSIRYFASTERHLNIVLYLYFLKIKFWLY